MSREIPSISDTAISAGITSLFRALEPVLALRFLSGGAAVLLMLMPLAGLADTQQTKHWTDTCQEEPPAYLASPAARFALVLIIDDLGHQLRNGMAVADLPGKINLAVLPHTPHGRRIANAGHKVGKEILLHAPMSNVSNIPLGSGALTPALSRQEFEKNLLESLASVPHVQGVNNHMGSELTQRAQQMGWLMQVLRRRNLYFIDSRTSAATIAATTATAYGVPNLSRAVFLDNERTWEAIDERFQRLLARAKKTGLAVGIGHPYPVTSAYLRKALPALKCRGVELVLASEALEPNFNTTLGHVGLGLGNSVLPEVEDAGREHRIGTPQSNTLN